MLETTAQTFANLFEEGDVIKAKVPCVGCADSSDARRCGCSLG